MITGILPFLPTTANVNALLSHHLTHHLLTYTVSLRLKVKPDASIPIRVGALVGNTLDRFTQVSILIRSGHGFALIVVT